MVSRAMGPKPRQGRAGQWWEEVQADSDRSQIQELIRNAIHEETIRVIPGEGGRVRIIPRPALSPGPRRG